MPINANLLLQAQPAQIPMPDPNAGMNALARAMQIKSAMQESDVNALRMQEMRRGIEDQNYLRGELAKPDVDPYKVMLGRGMLKEANDFRKNQVDAEKTKAQTEKDRFDMAHKRVDSWGQVMGFVRQNPTPENAVASVQHLVTLGVMPMEMAQQAIASVQADPSPQGIAKWATMGFQAALSAKDQLPKYESRNLGGSTQMTATDPVSGKVSVVNSVQNTQSPDNKATNARVAADAAASRAQAERHFNANQSAPQYMETDAGLVALPKKLAPGQQPVGTPVLGAGGQPLGKPLKDIPPAVNTAIIQNTQSLNQIDRALTLLKGDDVGTQKGDKNATGLKGYLPQTALNRIDPKGVDTRAEIADIGSLKIHDRSGAAVTISESPRLVPFVPQATDDAETVKKKLSRLRTELVNEANALAQTYSKDQGYKPSPVRPVAPGGNTGGATGDFGDGWKIERVK